MAIKGGNLEFKFVIAFLECSDIEVSGRVGFIHDETVPGLWIFPHEFRNGTLGVRAILIGYSDTNKPTFFGVECCFIK